MKEVTTSQALNVTDLRPEYYVEKRFLYTDSSNPYKSEPIIYCNGKPLSEYDKDSYVAQHWSSLMNLSYWYKALLHALNNESPIWENEEEKYHAAILIKESSTDKRRVGSITPLLPFEIMLMNRGYRMTKYSRLNAYDPMYRVYTKENEKIKVGFGLNGSNFYFNMLSRQIYDSYFENTEDFVTRLLGGDFKFPIIT